MTTKTITERVGAVVVRVQVETLESRVDFADILEAVKVSPDEHSPAPWEDCDGFEHTITPADKLIDEIRATRMQGYCYADRRRKVITLPEGEDYGVFDYHRARGASKQVARELSAQARAKTIAQLKRWYQYGWQCWYVSCDYLGAHDSLGGVYDDSGDYLEDVKREVAENVAAELESQGFEVFGKPEAKPRLTARHMMNVLRPDDSGRYASFYELSPRSMSPDEWRAEFRRNLNSQNRV